LLRQQRLKLSGWLILFVSSQYHAISTDFI
jgi:hypothetical protein